MQSFNQVANKASIDRTIAALNAKGLEAVYAATAAEAVKKVLELVPAGSEVMTMSSITIDTIGLSKEFNESGNFDAVKTRLYAMDQKTQGREMRKYGAAPDVAVGSVHALTETGSLMIASLTGSQLPAYAYSAGTVVWVVGANKIVPDLEAGFERIEKYVTPQESVRARKAYGLPDTFTSSAAKVLIINREVNPARAKVVIVGEALGF